MKRIEQKNVRGRMLSVWMNKGAKKRIHTLLKYSKVWRESRSIEVKKCLTSELCETDARVKLDREIEEIHLIQLNKE